MPETLKAVKRQLLTLDHIIMQCIGKYGHIGIQGLSKLMPDKRPKKTRSTSVQGAYGLGIH